MGNDLSTFAMKSEVMGSGSPVVLVPGGLTGWLSWKPHAEILASSRKVVRVQLLSVEYGLQHKPLPGNYSVGLESQALANALDAISIQEADFVAWSFGAEVALDFALNNPARVRSLALIEPPAIWVLRSRGQLSPDLVEARKMLQSIGLGEVSEEQLAWFSHFAGFVPEGVDPRGLPQWPVWSAHRQSLRTGDAAYRHQDDISRVRAFQKPVLLFKGEGSSKFLHEIIDVLGEEFPDARVQSLPGGHAPQIASMPRFIQIFTAFLEHAVAGH